MPARAFQVCARAGCGKLAHSRFCPEHRRTPEEERKRFDRGRATDPIRRLYFTAVWQATRRAILFRDPVCRLCQTAPATVADHVIPARKYVAKYGGDLARFFDETNLEGVCKPCHDRKTAEESGFAGGKAPGDVR
jgi:5-methylcytosine-specific restriction enzyme A